MKRLDVITGGMFSAKSTELTRVIERYRRGGRSVLVFTSNKDERYGNGVVSTHNLKQTHAIKIERYEDINEYLSDEVDVIAIDEGQFIFGEYSISEILSKNDLHIVIAGLDMDSMGVPFDNMARLMAYADGVTKLKAVCTKCGEDATFSQRIGDVKYRIDVGSDDKYEARCRNCYEG